MADRHINIRLGSKFNGSGFSAALKSIRDITKGAADIKSAFDMGLGAVRGAFEKIGSLFSSSFKFESQTRQFKTLIGDIDEAKAHMADLKALGDTPPFSIDQFAAASRSLMVMTDGVLGYKQSLEMLGDAAAATGQPIEQMGHAVGRLFASIRDGQPLSRAVMQLRNMGVITPEVAQKLQDLQKAGASGAQIWAEVEAQLKRYNGAMKEAEGTGEGLMAAIQSRWENIVRAFGDAMSDTAKGGMGEVLSTMEELEESGAVEDWADSALEAFNRVKDGALAVCGPIATAFGAVWKTLKGLYESTAQSVGNFAGTRAGGGSLWDAFKAGVGGFKQGWVDAFDSDGAEADMHENRREKRRREREARRAEKERKDAERAAEEDARKIAALKDADAKRAEEAAKKAADAEVAAAQKVAAERERLEKELHKKRMADLRAEIDAQKKAVEPLRNVASAAQSEFDRAFAMYRDPEQAAAQIAEERDYAADLKQLHKDASRYGGKWRIDELASLMSAGDTQGVQSRLDEWRKSKSFTPQVEAMVRASAAEQTKTTAEDELRKLNEKTGELTQKLESLAATRDTKLDGIETNTNQLAAKVDELLSVK